MTSARPSLLAILKQIGLRAVIPGNQIKRQEQRLKLAKRHLRKPCVTRGQKAARKRQQKTMRRNPAMYVPVAEERYEEADRLRDCFEKLANWAAKCIGESRLDVQRAVLTADLTAKADAQIIKELRTLDQLSETEQVIEELRAEYPDVVPLGLPKRGRQERSKRRRRKTDAAPRPLTAKQAEAVQIVGECKGNFSEAARRLGKKDRTTVRQHYNAGLRKLGRKAVKHGTQRLPSDKRGQDNVTSDDDRRLR